MLLMGFAAVANAASAGDQCFVTLDGAPTPYINAWAGARPCKKRTGTLTEGDSVTYIRKGVRANCQGAGNYMYSKVELNSGATAWCVPYFRPNIGYPSSYILDSRLNRAG